jgi:hypothetical protein
MYVFCWVQRSKKHPPDTHISYYSQTCFNKTSQLRLGLQSGPIHSDFHTKILCAFLNFPNCVARLNSPRAPPLKVLIMYSEGHKSWSPFEFSPACCNFPCGRPKCTPQYPVYSIVPSSCWVSEEYFTRMNAQEDVGKTAWRILSRWYGIVLTKTYTRAGFRGRVHQ